MGVAQMKGLKLKPSIFDALGTRVVGWICLVKMGGVSVGEGGFRIEHNLCICNLFIIS